MSTKMPRPGVAITAASYPSRTHPTGSLPLLLPPIGKNNVLFLNTQYIIQNTTGPLEGDFLPSRDARLHNYNTEKKSKILKGDN